MLAQLRARGIRDGRLLAAMERVPREAFVPTALADRVYDDAALPIGHGQTISQPYIVALMIEQLELTGTERVLEIGAGSGYAAAILDELAAEVVAVELVAELAERARSSLAATGHERVDVRTGDGSLGVPGEPPFDAILVSAATPGLPDRLVAQLAPGGRLVAPVGDRDEQQLVRLDVTPDGVTRTIGPSCRFVPLLGAAGFPSGAADPAVAPATLARPRWRIRP